MCPTAASLQVDASKHEDVKRQQEAARADCHAQCYRVAVKHHEIMLMTCTFLQSEIVSKWQIILLNNVSFGYKLATHYDVI